MTMSNFKDSGENGVHSCKDGNSSIHLSSPDKWPQRPILLCPTPRSGMKIRGVRHSSSQTYLHLPGTDGCALPINNGMENPGECLVIDFESDLFVGTAMLRIKNVRPLQCDSGGRIKTKDTRNYFHGKKRTFQCMVRGRFKVADIPMSECVTGQVFHRPAENLPPWYITQGAISVISYLAPQLQARLDGDCPRFLSPLVSTAQTAIAMSYSRSNAVDEDFSYADQGIEDTLLEPQPSNPSSLLQHVYNETSEIPPDSKCVTARQQARKRVFNSLHSFRDKTPTFDPNSEYTFEFLQHLLLFDEFALNINPIGKIPLHRVLNGQPLKFMAAQQVRGDQCEEEMRWLWSFDLWHENLYDQEDASSSG